MPRNVGGRTMFGSATTETGTSVVSQYLTVLDTNIKPHINVQNVEDLEVIIGYLSNILGQLTYDKENNKIYTNKSYFAKFDPFGLGAYEDLDTLISILSTIISIFDIVKIVMEQKGFKGTGLNVSVNVAPKQVNFLM